MNMYVNVENLVYKFIKFLEHNSLYAKMTIKKNEWEAIIIEYECIDAKKFFFISSLSACSLWLWHCLDIMRMLNYMYLDQSRCFISFHWSITSIVCINKCFQPNNFFLSCSRFLASSCSFYSTLLFSIVIFLS